MSNNFLLTFKGYLTQNINPSLGLSNGTPVIYHSLTLSPLEDMHSVMERMVNNDGSDIFLKFQPTYIHVEVPTLDPVLFQHKSLFKDKVVIPVKLKSQAEEHKIHFPLKNYFITVKGKAHAVVLAFAITVHKMQGQTCSRLVLDINQRLFKPSLTYHGIYVALSRVLQMTLLIDLLPSRSQDHYRHGCRNGMRNKRWVLRSATCEHDKR
jgi:hypothetical protein